MSENIDDPKTLVHLVDLISKQFLKNGATPKLLEQIKKALFLVITYTTKAFFENVNDPSKTESVIHIIIDVMNSLLIIKNQKDLNEVLEYYVMAYKYVLQNIAFSYHYTIFYSVINQLLNNNFHHIYLRHTEILSHVYKYSTVALIMCHCPEPFLGKIPFRSIVDQDAINLIKLDKGLKEFRFTNNFEIIYYATIGGLIRLHALQINAFVDIFGSAFLEDYNNIIGSMKIDYSPYRQMDALCNSVVKLYNASIDTPFQVLHKIITDPNNAFYPSNPPMSYEKEVSNRLAVIEESNCSEKHSYFIPFNLRIGIPAISQHEKCKLCEEEKLKDHDNTQNHRKNSLMLYPKEANYLDTYLYESFDGLQPIEIHILRIIQLYGIIMANKSKEEEIIEQIRISIKCISALIFPYVPVDSTFISTIRYIRSIIDELSIIFKCFSNIKNPNLENRTSFSSNHSFRAMFQEIISPILKPIFENLITFPEEIAGLENKITAPLIGKYLLREFLFNAELRKRAPGIYAFLRLHSRFDRAKDLENFNFKDDDIKNKLIDQRLSDLLDPEARENLEAGIEWEEPQNPENNLALEIILWHSSAYNEFVSIINDRTEMCSIPAEVGKPMPIADTDYLWRELSKLLDTFDINHHITITKESDDAFCRVAASCVPTFCAARQFSFGSHPSLTLQKGTLSPSRALSSEQQACLASCVVRRGKGIGLALLADRLAAVVGEGDGALSVVDVVNREELKMEAIEADAYRCFLDAKDRCAAPFIVSQLPAIAAAGRGAPYADGSLCEYITAGFLERCGDPTALLAVDGAPAMPPGAEGSLVILIAHAMQAASGQDLVLMTVQSAMRAVPPCLRTPRFSEDLLALAGMRLAHAVKSYKDLPRS